METAIIIIIIIIITIITLLVLPRFLLLCDGVLVTSKCLVNFIKLSNYQIEKRHISCFSSLLHHTQVLKNMLECVRKGFPSGAMVKNPPANAGDSRDMGSIPGWGRSPGKGSGNPFQILAWKIPWTEESGELQSLGSQSQTWPSLSTHAGCVSSTSLVQEGLGQCMCVNWLRQEDRM